MELMLIALRLKLVAPDFSGRIEALALELQKALVVNRAKLN